MNIENKDILLIKNNEDDRNSEIKVIVLNENIITEKGRILPINWLKGLTISKIWRGAGTFENCNPKNLVYDIDKPVFCKDDLETGDFVKCKNGTLGIVLKEVDAIALEDGRYIIINEMNNDLTMKYAEFTKFNIVKIWRGVQCFIQCNKSEYQNKIIYKR